jgi:hypothetical protein
MESDTESESGGSEALGLFAETFSQPRNVHASPLTVQEAIGTLINWKACAETGVQDRI